MSEQTSSKLPRIRFKGFEGDWQESTVSDFAVSLDAGVSVNSEDRIATSTEFGILKTSAVTNGVFQADENKAVLTKSEQSRLKESVSGGTIIISRMNTPALVGANAYVESSHKNLFLPDRLWAAKPRGDTSMRFLACILGSEKGRDALSKLAKGTSGSMKNITKPDVLAFSVMASSPAEQTQIGEYFRELDSLIGLHQRKHDKLVTLKKAMLQKMFPQAGASTPEIRFKGFSEAWEEKELGELVSFYKGKGLPKSEIDPLGREACIHYGQLFTEYSEEISTVNSRTKGGNGYLRSIANDVLMPTSDVTPRGLAKASALNESDVIIGGDILVIRADKKLLLGFFLSRFIRHMEGQVLQMVSGSTVFHLYSSSMKKFQVKYPSLSEQQKIGTYFRTLDELISQHAIQLQKLQQIKSACLEKMFV